MILGIDAGNYQVKVVGERGVMSFYSDIGEYRDLRLKQYHGEDDMVVEYEGEKYFAGTLAKFESEYGGTIMGNTKAHKDAKLRVLIALHKYCNDRQHVSIVTNQPIEKHIDSEKVKIKNMLKGSHTLSINGEVKTLFIDRIEVAPEGACAIWSDQYQGKVRIIDIGSGTVNCATIQDMRYVDKDSFTINFGANTNMTNNLEYMTQGIIRQVSRKWQQDDFVLLAGGIADDILPFIKSHFVEATTIKPKLQTGNKIQVFHPVFANAIGAYQIGVGMYA